MKFHLLASASDLRDIHDHDGQWDDFKLEKVFEADSVEDATVKSQKFLDDGGFKLGDEKSWVNMKSFWAELREIKVVAKFKYRPRTPAVSASPERIVPPTVIPATPAVPELPDRIEILQVDK